MKNNDITVKNCRIEAAKTVEEHRLKLFVERNHYKQLHEQAIDALKVERCVFWIIIAMLVVALIAMVGVNLYACRP